MSLEIDNRALVFEKRVPYYRLVTCINLFLLCALPRPRKVYRRLDDGASQCYQSPSVQEHYSRLYYEAMDLAITSIKDRFDPPGFHMYRNLETVLVNAANKKEYIEELKEILAFYSDDFNEAELRTQLQIFGESFKIAKGTSILCNMF